MLSIVLCVVVCMEILSVKDLILALKDFSNWKELGSKLGMSNKLLASIEAENQDLELRKRAMLRAWYNAQGDGVCWEMLIDALILLKETALAKKIAKKNDVIWA